MVSAIERWMGRIAQPARTEERVFATVDDYIGLIQEFYYNGLAYSGLAGSGTYDRQGAEEVPPGFVGRVQYAYQSNGVVFACQVARMLVFTEGRLIWQEANDQDGKFGDYFVTESLDVVDRPWPGGTVHDLLARMLQDADVAGNAYIRRVQDVPRGGVQLERLRPDWTVIMVGRQRGQVTDNILGYLYFPEGIHTGADPIQLGVDEVAHWAPIPDPLYWRRGMSWMTPVIREIKSDGSAMNHRLKYYENAATPNLIIGYDPQFTFDQYKRMMEYINAEYQGSENAGKIMHLAGGADPTIVGTDMEQQDYKNIMGHNETRICAAARVPPVIVGLSEGLQAATYSNYGQARRHFADSWARPYWRSAAAAISTILRRPRRRSRLTFDPRGISFLQEDQKDAAEIEHQKASTITQLIRDGFTAESAVDAVVNEDLTRLVHSGFLSVQLQEPGVSGDLDDGPSDEGADDGDDADPGEDAGDDGEGDAPPG